ncbi:MAG: hypothetical protein RM022_025615 [Nostoc sp. EfeVER01]|uniref:hypothetical protein n=1 Tax=unclassified Nostoc TaxID=2593658 RepID=UPI002AD25462|nr:MULTISPECIES: hypothetical protein [unclassified Nostoc]MDZ7948525.1 hypothetical protein [Nostoc sp. EfeVER01]MDZ7992145.1 hypothetical protein [Nostoc sp. EspVER01]
MNPSALAQPAFLYEMLRERHGSTPLTSRSVTTAGIATSTVIEVSKQFFLYQGNTELIGCSKIGKVNHQGSFTVIPALESSTHRSCMGVIQINSYYIDITRLLSLGVG